MSSTNKKQNEHLTREEIQSYLSTHDEREKRIIEGKALNNEFDNDALEGWSAYGTGMSDLKQLDKKYNPLPKTWIIYSVITVILVAAGIYVYTSQQNQPIQTATVNLEKTDYILPDSVEKLIVVPKNELITLDEIKVVKQQVKSTTEKKTTEKTQEIIEKEEITVNDLPVVQPSVTTKKPTLQKIKAKEIYLNNLKLIDYRNYRKKPELTVESIQLSGVPADQEVKGEQLRESAISMIEISYYDYISKTTLLLDDGAYKKALARCNIILSHYPDDVNALFYSGVCYYNLAEYNRAIEVLKLCMESKFNNFDEEAEWMLANSYQANGEKDKAKAMFQSIKEKGGFYSKKL